MHRLGASLGSLGGEKAFRRGMIQLELRLALCTAPFTRASICADAVCKYGGNTNDYSLWEPGKGAHPEPKSVFRSPSIRTHPPIQPSILILRS